MTRYSRKKHNDGYSARRKQIKIKRKTKDLDEINEDLQPERANTLLNQEVDVDVPGAAQFYCLHCARYFIDNHAMTEHFRTKVHKRRLENLIMERYTIAQQTKMVKVFFENNRLKALEMEPYSQKEAEAAASMGNYQAPKRRKIVTQNVETDMEVKQ